MFSILFCCNLKDHTYQGPGVDMCIGRQWQHAINAGNEAKELSHLSNHPLKCYLSLVNIERIKGEDEVKFSRKRLVCLWFKNMRNLLSFLNFVLFKAYCQKNKFSDAEVAKLMFSTKDLVKKGSVRNH